MTADLTIRSEAGRVFFTHDELCDPATREGKLAHGFAEALLLLRKAFGEPMMVTSCCRSLKRNNLIGGHPKSLHIYNAPRGHQQIDGCCAIDIQTASANAAHGLAFTALKLGWSVGVGKTFLHLDRRRDFGLPLAIFGY